MSHAELLPGLRLARNRLLLGELLVGLPPARIRLPRLQSKPSSGSGGKPPRLLLLVPPTNDGQRLAPPFLR